MQNQNNQKKAEFKRELGSRINISVLAKRHKLFDAVGKNLFTQQFKLGKTEEEILIVLLGKLSIPTNSLNAIPSPFKLIDNK